MLNLRVRASVLMQWQHRLSSNDSSQSPMQPTSFLVQTAFVHVEQRVMVWFWVPRVAASTPLVIFYFNL